MKFEEAIIEYRKGNKIKRNNGMMKQWLYKEIIDSHDLIFDISFNDIVAEDWEVLEKTGKTFPEVFEAFKDGQKIRSKRWVNNWYYIQISDTGDLELDVEDLLANDWEILL